MSNTQEQLQGQVCAKFEKPLRTNGATTKVYRVDNNFETYWTSEIPSQEYISAYVAHCMITLKMPLHQIYFTYFEQDIFCTLQRVGRYKLP